VIYVAKAQPMNGLAGWLSTRLGRAGLALDCDDYEAASNTFGGAWQRGIVNWWEERLPRLAHAVTVNTTFLAGRCVRAGVSPERVLLVPNGFDPDLFGPVPEATRDVIRNRWGLDGRKMVLYIGSLSFTNHPLLLLLDAFVQVRRRNSSALLLVVGGGEDYDAVVRAIEERGLTGHVVVTGRASRAEVPGIYAASHIVVDPVDDDDVARARSPLKIAESLAMGIPVVTGDVGDRAMMLGEGQAGVLVKPGCPESLAEGIISLLTDQERYAWASEQARVISPRFCWEHLAAEFVKVFSFF
jgi:glycosyltransferase involved in cell wall biosynthesis